VRLSERQQKQLEELQAKLLERFGPLLATPEGEQLVAFLSREFFDGELLGDTPEETAFNLGAREVVRRMRRVRDLFLKQRTA
jgi:hypothetical protein